MKKLGTIIEEQLKKYDQDRDMTVEAVYDIIMDDDEFKEEFVKPLIITAIRVQVNKYQLNARHDIFKSNNLVPKQPDDNLTTVTKGVSGEDLQKNQETILQLEMNIQKDVLLNMYYANCKKRLSEMQSDDISTEINVFSKHGIGNEKQAVFLRFIYDELIEGMSVGQQFSNDKLKIIRMKAEEQVDRKWSRIIVHKEENKEIEV